MFNAIDEAKDRTTQTNYEDKPARRSWSTWIAATCILSAHTLLIIAVIWYTSGCSHPPDPRDNLAQPYAQHPVPPQRLVSNGNQQLDSNGNQQLVSNGNQRLVSNGNQQLVSNGNQRIVSHGNESNLEPKLNVAKPVTIAGPVVQKLNTKASETTMKVIPMTDYLKKRDKRVFDLEYNFSVNGEHICTHSEPVFLVMLCTTKHYEKSKRDMIRNTWGSIATTQTWPRLARKFEGIKLVFVVGHPQGHISKYDTAIQDENKEFGDIIQADFVDSAKNASTKILLGLKWASDFCPDAKFVLRVGDDQFVHVANLVTYLENLRVPDRGCVVGKAVSRRKVARKGRWAVAKSLYPYGNYPAYVTKSSYVISGDVVKQLYTTAEYLPYIFIEDAYITGILRSAVGARLVRNAGFTKGSDPKPKLCGFHNDFRITSNTVPSLTQNLWQSLHRNLKNCYTLPAN